MDAVIFVFGVLALVAGINKLTGAKSSWYRPARESRWQFREPEWMRKVSGVFLILYAVISFVAIGVGWFR